ncbi:MAG: hypothetical protein H0U47_10570, partial [Nocardioidaceae bacterium]|nr:hypothetical protein [Nocardioidaceae bacterium]
ERARPWASAVLVLALLTVVAARTLLTGGELYGGALLPAPGGALDWWAAYTAGWHPVGTGSVEPSPPYVLLLAGAGLATLGDAGAAVSLLVLGAPVLAALTAHRLLRRAGAGPVAAAWASLAYGSLPLVTGAVAQGRLGTVLGTVVLPVLATTVLSLSTADSSGTGPARLERWIRRSRAGLAAAVLVAVAPVAWPLLVVAAVLVVVLAVVLAVVTSGRRPGRRVATPPLPQVVVSSAVVVAVPWLLGPWWLAERIADPMLFWWEAGLPDAGVGALDPGPVDLALGMPGGPGGAVAWLGAGVLLAAVVALARTSRRGPVLVAWTAGALGLLTAAVGVLADGAGDPTTGLTTVWVGFPLVVWWGGLVTAVAVGSHDLGPMLAGRSFGWRQLTVAGVAVLALLGPLVALGWAVAEGIATPLTRAEAVPLPAYMAEDARAGPRPSVAVLAGSTDQLAATIVREDGWRIGEEPMWAAAAPPALTEPLSRLLAAPTEDDLDAIAGLGVGYLYAPAPVDPKLAAALDSAPGIAPAGAPEGDRGWRLDRPAGTLQTDSRALALSTDRADGGPPWTATPARAPRQVSLAAAPAPGWTAELDGRRLQAAPGDRAVQTFAVPQPVPAETDGRLTVSYDDDRSWWVAGQLVALVAVVLLAAPSRRGRP